MANVLIIASDRMIGGLMGQLTDLIGHAAQFSKDGDELRDAIGHSRPDVVMLDVAYGSRTMDLAAVLAAEVGAALVYFAAGVPANELRRLAFERGAKYFALPAGPKLLGGILASALFERSPGRQVDGSSTAYCAVTKACVAVSRARTVADNARSIRAESRSIRAEKDALVAECRRLRADLREAVMAYTRELRGAGFPPDRTLEMVKTALRAPAHGSSPPNQTAEDIDDAVEWCLQAYYAA
jgi:DNA-binding response OmpR family regulator